MKNYIAFVLGLLFLPQVAFGAGSPPLYQFTTPLSITNGVVSMTPADGTHSGYVSTGVQSFAGAKTFLSAAQFNAAVSGSVDFVAPYFTSSDVNAAATGTFRAPYGGSLVFRNFGNTGDLPVSTDSSNNLTFNGHILQSQSGVVPVASGGTGLASYTTGDMIYASGATTLLKLPVGGANTVLVTNGTSPSWSTLVNANVANGAAIAVNKLAALSASTAVVTDGSGVLASASTTATQLGYLSAATGTTGTTSTNLVFSASPTLTGTLTVPAVLVSGLSASQAVFTDGSKNLVSNALTGTGNVVMSASPTLSGTVTLPSGSVSSSTWSYGASTFSGTGNVGVGTASPNISGDSGTYVTVVGATTPGNVETGVTTATAVQNTTVGTFRFFNGTNRTAVIVGENAANNSTNGNLRFYTLNSGVSTQALVLSSAQAATFASTVTGTGFFEAGTPATAGFIRQANNNNGISWRNAANSANVTMWVDASNNFRFGSGNVVLDAGSFSGQTATLSNLTINQAVVTDGSKNLVSLAYTNANTASTLVQRDGSGNFSAGTITAAITGTASGNTTYTANNHGVVISGAANAMTVIAPDASASKVLKSGGASADPSWLAYDNANTVSTLVARDGSGNFSAGTITASLTGHSSLDLSIANNLSDVNSAQTSFNNISGMTTLGDMIYGGASGTRTILSGQTTSTKKYLSQTGNGSVSAAPAWAQVAFADLSGSVAAGQMPALTGDITTSAGAVATTMASSISGAKTFSTSLTSPAFISSTANAASAGAVRLASTDSVAFRNNGNAADILLAKNASDQLTWAGTAVLSSSGILLGTAFPALTGDVTTSAGALATTVAKIAGTTVSGTTGTGNVVFSASPTHTGTIIAASMTASGTVQVDGQLIGMGVAGSGAAAAGYIGEVLSGTQSSFQSNTNGNALNLTSIALTNGDWDVWGIVAFTGSGATSTIAIGAIDTSNSGLGTSYNGTRAEGDVNLASNSDIFTVGPIPIKIANGVTTTYYLNTRCDFSAGTVTSGGTIYARRRR